MLGWEPGGSRGDLDDDGRPDPFGNVFAVSDQSMLTGLCSLVSGTAQRLDALFDHDALWCTPAPGSEAAADLANQETGPGGAWGEPPVRDVLDITWMALGLAGEDMRAFGALLALPPRTCYDCEVLARAALEAASLAFWLTESGIDVRSRVARSMAYRMNGAMRMEEALDNMGGPRSGEQRGDYGELRADVTQDAADHGLTLTQAGRSWKCEDQRYPGYLARASALSARFSHTPPVPYQVYSGVAHAELWGLWRGVEQLPKAGHPHYRHRLTFIPLAVHSATQTLLAAVTVAASRTATYLGASDATAELVKWAGEADQQLDILRPA